MYPRSMSRDILGNNGLDTRTEAIHYSCNSTVAMKAQTKKTISTKPEAKALYLSPHFDLAQLTYSETALRRNINNAPPKRTIGNLTFLAAKLEKIVHLLGHPIAISSGYRSKALNEAVGGSKMSQHVQGLAVDFTCKRFGSPYRICKAIAESAIQFDQLILEHGMSKGVQWVHLSFSPKKRRQVLTICASGNYCREGLHIYRRKNRANRSRS